MADFWQRWFRLRRPRGLALVALMLIAVVVALTGSIALFLWRPAAEDVAAKDGITLCRPCASLAGLERSMRAALEKGARIEGRLTASEIDRIISQITGWRRRCGTLMCELPASPAEPCRSPTASLLAELAAVDELTETLMRRTAQCATGGCQSTDCDQARVVEATFTSLRQELRALAADNVALGGEKRQLATGFLYSRLDSLDETVLAAPRLVAGGQYAAAEVRLLLLRDETAAAEGVVPGSAEAYLADRLDELADAIDELAQGERVGASGLALAELWSTVAGASARLLVEAATIKAEMKSRSDAFQTILRGGEYPKDGEVKTACEGTLRLVGATGERLSAALDQVYLCNQRADCHRDADVDVTASTPRQRSSRGRGALERIAEERGQAADALRTLFYERDGDVVLETDLKTYVTGEAVTLRPQSEENRCLAESGTRLVLVPADLDPVTLEAAVDMSRVDSADPASWMFEAPEPGSYKFALLTAETRGAGLFGVSAPIAVLPFSSTCREFNGAWETDLGRMTLIVRDGIARGTYRKSASGRAGILRGQVRGNVLQGRWLSELGLGGTRLVLAEDGRRFEGTWSHLPDKVAGAGLWNGQCTITAATAPEGMTGAGTP